MSDSENGAPTLAAGVEGGELDVDLASYPVLVVDDEPDNTEAFRLNFKRRFSLLLASSGEDALAQLEQHDDVAVLVTDQRMPGMDGITLLERVRERSPDTVRIVLTAYTDPDVILGAVNRGDVWRFLVKPWNAADMEATIKAAIERYHLVRENRRLVDELRRTNAYLREEIREGHDETAIVGGEGGLAATLDSVNKVAPTTATALLRGESGTGKELIARAIHEASPRRAKAFVKVNCAAIPEGLLESELFGHEKGSFTGAHARRIGRFELADKGTIFLDEIGDVSAAMQVKLLRILQEQEFERVGGAETKKVDVRVIAATNRDLEKMMKDGEFREDLYFRLAVFPVDIPPLRERRGDVAALVDHFVARGSKKLGQRRVPRVDPEARRRLTAYPWPGNVRELENVIERALILCGGAPITTAELRFLDRYAFAMGGDEAGEAARTASAPADGASGAGASAPASSAEAAAAAIAAAGDEPLPKVLERLERDELVRALEKAGGSKAKAARELGINRSTLYYRLKRHGLDERFVESTGSGEDASEDGGEDAGEES